MTRFRRAAAATGILVTGAFIIGALVGGAFETFVFVGRGGLAALARASRLEIILLASVIVGGITAVITPVLAWIGLRRFVLGEVILYCALGAGGGAISAGDVGERFHLAGYWGLAAGFAGAIAGGCIIGVAMHFDNRSSRHQSPVEEVSA
jgi:hypothetical protein